VTVLNRAYERCMEAKQFSAAPLMFTCGPPNSVEVVVGWAGWIAIVGGLLSAITISGVLLGYAAARMIPKAPRPSSAHLVASTGVVTFATTAVLSMDPDSYANATGSGIILVSAAALAALTLSLGVGGVVRALIASRRQR
jgi:hypothetical protein